MKTRSTLSDIIKSLLLTVRGLRNVWPLVAIALLIAFMADNRAQFAHSLFQSVQSPLLPAPTNTPPPPPANTPPPTATNAPLPPPAEPTHTPAASVPEAPPTTTPDPAADVPTQASVAEPPPTGPGAEGENSSQEEASPVEEKSPSEQPQPGPDAPQSEQQPAGSDAGAPAAPTEVAPLPPTPAIGTGPEAEAEPADVVLNETALVDTVVQWFAWLWLCIGVGVILLVPFIFLFLQLRGSRLKR